MGELDRLPKSFTVTFKADEDGFIGRECPNDECGQYFKIDTDTFPEQANDAAVEEEDEDEQGHLSCPYCGHEDDLTEFTTAAQMEYAQSVVYQKVFGAVVRDLKKLEFDIKPKGMFGIGISMKLKPSPTPPLRYYSEKDLETEVVCDSCRFRFTIYGVFGYCPCCRSHNSLQSLDKSLAVAEKLLDRAAAEVERELQKQVIGDALSKAVAACDGFGRCICELHSAKATDPKRVERLSFQNLAGARKNVLELFGFDFAGSISIGDWELVCRAFQKRHLLAHSMGVVDDEYAAKANDPAATVGRKVRISIEEVQQAAKTIRLLGRGLSNGLTPTVAKGCGPTPSAQSGRTS